MSSVFSASAMARMCLLAFGGDFPDHVEIVLGIDRAILGRQVADMAVGGEDRVVGPEILVDCLGLGRGFDDDDGHAIPLFKADGPGRHGAAPCGSKRRRLSTGGPVPAAAPHRSDCRCSDVGRNCPVRRRSDQRVQRRAAAGGLSASDPATEARRAAAGCGLPVPASDSSGRQLRRRQRQVADQLILGQRAGAQPGQDRPCAAPPCPPAAGAAGAGPGSGGRRGAGSRARPVRMPADAPRSRRRRCAPASPRRGSACCSPRRGRRTDGPAPPAPRAPDRAPCAR